MIVLGITIAYLLVSLAVGLWPSRRSSDSADGFVAGDRSLGLLVMYFITGATIFSAFAFLGAPGWAYSRGAAVFYVLGYGALGFIPFYFLGPRAARLGRAFGFVTQGEMVAARFDSRALAGTMAVVATLAFIPYLALQMKGAGHVLFVVSHGKIPVALGAALVYLVVLAYVLGSGVLGVGWTNTFQGMFMMVLAWGLGLYLPWKLYGSVSGMFERIAEVRPEWLVAPGLAADGGAWSWSEYSTAVLVSAIGFSFWPHLFMKAFTAKDLRTIRRTVVLYPTFQLFLVPIFLIGFSGVLFHSTPESPDQILPHMLMELKLPAVWVGLFCAGALAASMSSGDAMAHACASIIVRDGVVRAGKKRLTPHAERSLIRFMLLLVLIAAYVTAMAYEGSLVSLLLLAFGPVGQFAPVVFAALYWRRANGRAVMTGLVLGSVTTIMLSLYPEWRPFPWHAGVFGWLANIAALVSMTMLARDGAHAPEQDRFVEIAAGRRSAVTKEDHRDRRCLR